MGPVERILAGIAPYVEGLVQTINVWLFEPIGIAAGNTPWVWIFILFMMARLENQRWVSARIKDFLGTPGPIGAFIDLSGGIALVFAIGFIVALGYDQGWLAAFSFAILGLIVTLVWSIISDYLYGKKAGMMWVAGTTFVWVGMYMLIDEVSWFGKFIV